MNEKMMLRVLEEIDKIHGFDARHYKLSTLKRRLCLRLLATQTNSYEEYLNFIKKNPSECEKFLETLTINVTDFFREKNVFLSLKQKILPALLDSLSRKKRKTLRALSIGCAEGQEPYSLAIILSEIREKMESKIKIFIHATDINRNCLSRAKKGRYGMNQVKSVPRTYLLRYFQNHKNSFEVKPSIKKMVRFKRHDIIKGNNLGKFDLILCRNLFIFFESELQVFLLQKIHSYLRSRGILILGSCEFPKIEGLFRPLSARERIYERLN